MLLVEPRLHGYPFNRLKLKNIAFIRSTMPTIQYAGKDATALVSGTYNLLNPNGEVVNYNNYDFKKE